MESGAYIIYIRHIQCIQYIIYRYMKTIFCDGIFDLFHRGHLRHLEKIRQHFDEPIYLIVGVTNDVNSKKYKKN